MIITNQRPEKLRERVVSRDYVCGEGGGSRLMGDDIGEDRLVNPADFTLMTPFASDLDNLISIARNELQPLASSRGAVILAYHDRNRSRLMPAVFRASLAKPSLANCSAERLSSSTPTDKSHPIPQEAEDPGVCRVFFTPGSIRPRQNRRLRRPPGAPPPVFAGKT